MARRGWFLGLLGLALLLAACTTVPPRAAPTGRAFLSPVPAARGVAFFPAGKRVAFPLILVSGTRPPWPWPRWGYGRPTQYAVSDAALRQGIANFWWYDWSDRCLDDKQVPMVWRDVSPALWLCNDGRPLLLLNEPDRVGQADLTPEQAADRLHQVISGGWKGEVWCCGTAVENLAYADAVVLSYTSRFGEWSAAGWAVHAYSNQAEWVRDLDDAKKYVPRALADLDAFVAHMRARGLLGRGIVLSEYGALSAWWPQSDAWHSPKQLVPTFQMFADGLRKRKDVLAYGWFSSLYEPLSASDLLWSDGTLTELGAAWRVEAER